MDLVYSLGSGSSWENNEIRYSLRSVEKYLSVDNVFIIGERVDFLKDYGHIDLKETSFSAFNKQYNIFSKVLKACQTSQISDDFIYMADDHFWLKKVDTIPCYHQGDLYPAACATSDPAYKRTLMNTYNELLKKGLPTKNFNLHFPIVYNKKDFMSSVPRYRWGIYYGYAIKSLYCNSLKIPGECGAECKLRSPHTIDEIQGITDGKELFSIGDEALNQSMEDFLQETYPQVSRWEC